jgi:PAS domain S-box-containing protein
MTISRLEDGRYVDANERWLILAGFDREQLLGRTSVELGLWSEQERAQFAESLKRDHSVRDLEVVMRLAGGRQRTVLLSSELVDMDGEACIFSAVQDVTEVRKMEQQLRQKQKMEAIGTLAGGIAHDFNNLLTIIKGYSQLMEEKAQHDETLAGPLRHIGEAAERASSLIRQLLAFSRQQMLHPQVLKLNSSLSNVEKLLRRLIGEDIELITRYAPDLWAVKADPSQIEQVVMNLAVNARDAMPKGGKLIFETRNAEVGEREQQVHPVMKAGRYVLLTVTDTGMGMDAETQNRIFEPFFTTKAAGHGTGLGLATVYGIVKQSNGYIWVDSEPGRGASFQVYLPESVSEVVKTAALAPQEAAGRGSETILLVEDDSAVRKLAATVLSARGYKVLEAGGVKEAEALIQQHSGVFDLLLTDMVMPGASGQDLAQRVRSRYPSVRILFISGYSQGTHSWQGPSQPAEDFLQKPFSPTTLAARVRQTLDAAPAPASR